MLTFKGSKDLHRIVVLNPKGGSGKTTLAFNLAGYLASGGRKVALVDMDPQGSSTRWLQNRPPQLPPIHGISAIRAGDSSNRDSCIVVPDDIDYAVIDAPAGLAGQQLADYTCGAHAILIPVMPSDLDIHAATRLIKDLLLVAQVSRRNGRLGVVANRVKERTIAYRRLTSFLNSLSISVVGVIRDSQNYTHAASEGRSIHEMPKHRVSKDLLQWKSVTQWLERCLKMPVTSRDLLRPADTVSSSRRRKSYAVGSISVAAALALFLVSGWLLIGTRSANHDVPSAPAEIITVVSHEPVDTEQPDGTRLVSAAEELRQKWQLNGIAKVDGASILMLSDRHDRTVRQVSDEDDLDGWVVMDAGLDYAVLAQDGQKVRLVLSDESRL